MNSIKITDHRRWEENGYQYQECYVNGIPLKGRYPLHKGKRSENEKCMKRCIMNTCKMIKLFGDPLYKLGHLSEEEFESFRTTSLPEWGNATPII